MVLVLNLTTFERRNRWTTTFGKHYRWITHVTSIIHIIQIEIFQKEEFGNKRKNLNIKN